MTPAQKKRIFKTAWSLARGLKKSPCFKGTISWREAFGEALKQCYAWRRVNREEYENRQRLYDAAEALQHRQDTAQAKADCCNKIVAQWLDRSAIEGVRLGQREVESAMENRDAWLNEKRRLREDEERIWMEIAWSR